MFMLKLRSINFEECCTESIKVADLNLTEFFREVTLLLGDIPPCNEALGCIYDDYEELVIKLL